MNAVYRETPTVFSKQTSRNSAKTCTVLKKIDTIHSRIMSKGASIRGSVRIAYSEAFKRQVVEEIDSGRVSATGASRKYEIHGHMTVARWLQRYSRYRVPGTMVRMTSKEHEQQQRQKAQREGTAEERVRQLEQALADAQLQLREDRLRIKALETMIDLAEEAYRIPIRKNSGAGPSHA